MVCTRPGPAIPTAAATAPATWSARLDVVTAAAAPSAPDVEAAAAAPPKRPTAEDRQRARS